MKIRGYILLLTAVINASLLYAQGLQNEGRINVSGGYMVISGNYQNESSGAITLNGTITVSGNWTNNSSTNVIESPGTNGEVIFNGTGTQIIGGTANLFDFEKLTINSGSTTQVEAGKGVTAYGACTFTNPLVLKSTTTDFRPVMATFINNSTVTGNISMELSYSSTGSTASGTGRGLYFSSPISNATSTIFNVAHGTNLLWYQDEANRVYKKITTNGTALTVAKGYILRAPVDTVVNLTGTPNTAPSYTNNSIPRAVAGQFYLFGNPYPAVIDWETIATKTNLTNTVWYQTSGTSGTPMVVDTWNGDLQEGTSNNGTSSVDGKIPPMQSFWVQCSSVGLTGTLTVSNSDRSHNWGSSRFLKSPKQPISKDVMRVYLHSGEKRDEAIIVQSELAQDEFGLGDSRKMLLKDATSARAELYTLSPDINNKNLVIQSIKPVTSEKIVKLGLSVLSAGEYKFEANLSETSNLNNIYLEDKLLNVSQDLIANPEYTFTSDVTTTDDTTRFSIHFYSAPKVSVANTISVCAPETVDLTDESITKGSEPNLTYTYWTDAKATSQYLTPTSAETGTYYIKGTSITGRYAIAGPINVIINPTPTVITFNPAEVIDPATVDLTAPEITLGSSEGLLFSYWTDANATIPYSTPQFATQGDYYIKGTYESTGCYSIAGPVKVIVNASSTDIPTDIGNKQLIYASDNQVHIVNFELNSTVAIYDILGRQHYYQQIKSNHDIITSNLKSGIYIVRVVNGKSVNSKKVYLK